LGSSLHSFFYPLTSLLFTVSEIIHLLKIIFLTFPVMCF
jgi:hypothetical protein